MPLPDDVSARVQQRVGTIVRGRFRLDRLIGIGGMGAVFAVSDSHGQRFALKLLHRELSQNPSVFARFVREAFVANRIAHPGVARVFEHGTDEQGCAFLVMELLEGETLEQLWERSGHRLGVPQTLAYVERLLEVLDAAHAKGIVHRDIKPDNVFLTAFEVRVLDFGIARLLDGSGATASGQVMGTPAFMPPEQAAGHAKRVDATSDLWSVGAVTFTMLSGQHVHEARTGTEQLVYAATQQARSLASVAPHVPLSVVKTIDRALVYEPSGRWPSAKAMLAALRSADVAAFPPLAEAAPRPSDPPTQRPSMPAAATLIMPDRPPRK
jgi:serine/threonine protein kinase